jgi:multisubunit Na+/H+ antiporter MnhG subunit
MHLMAEITGLVAFQLLVLLVILVIIAMILAAAFCQACLAAGAKEQQDAYREGRQPNYFGWFPEGS